MILFPCFFSGSHCSFFFELRTKKYRIFFLNNTV
nr:MAG TPA: hypothetical protein [Caudoviricetes sp.]